MSSEKPTPERIVVDFPKTEIADEKTRRSVLRLALPLVLLPHVAQEFWLHSLLQRAIGAAFNGCGRLGWQRWDK
jgi:hypothetical protein